MANEITLSTPALLFPAISLLMLAYTNRFLALAALVRSLHAAYQTDRDERIIGQIRNLRTRLFLIRNMQSLGIFSMLLCVVCMFVLFEGWTGAGKAVFTASLLSLMGSLLLSLTEIQMSIVSLNLQLSDVESGK